MWFRLFSRFCLHFLIFILVSCGLDNDKNYNYINPPLKLKKIIIGKLSDQDNASALLNSIKIYMEIESDINKPWQIGFYSPHTYRKYPDLFVNNDLDLKICDLSEQNCSNMQLIIESDINKSDQTSGYMTIIKPENLFPLSQKKQYVIELLHNNQGVPNNYNAVIQSMFLIIDNKIYHLDTNKSIYDISTIYNQQVTDNIIESHLLDNLNNSESLIENNKILPSPVSFTIINSKESFMFNNIVIHNKLNVNQSFIFNKVCKEYINDFKGNFNCSYDNDQNASIGIIVESIDDPSIIQNNLEGYQIVAYPDKIIIKVMHNAGLFYAFETLRQLWQESSITSVNIIDYPRFKYRGLLLDVARHYFSVKEIESILDIMSTHKLNTLHIHFSDDEAFRLNLMSIPALNNIGAKRQYGLPIIATMLMQTNLENENIVTSNLYPKIDDLYSYSYSSDDIKGLIEYANFRNITIIPEIDIPGHSRAIIRSLPDSMYDKNDNSTFISVQGYTDNVLPICKYDNNSITKNQFTLNLNNIIQEITEKFNNQTTIYAQSNEISIGGDEVSSYAWGDYVECKQNIWESFSALQKAHYFFQLISNNFPNYKLSGWQQFIQTESVALGNYIVPNNKVGHVWIWNNAIGGIPQAVELANKNYPVVLAFADQIYFDVAYSPDFNEVGFNWSTKFSDTYASLYVALSASTILNSINIETDKSYILGVEGALWSENLPSYNHLIYMLLPKLTGMAQASWASESNTINFNNKKINWKNLINKLGSDNNGFLGYLNKIYSVKYRGYPNGISLELPNYQK